jgi:hypothetical protein
MPGLTTDICDDTLEGLECCFGFSFDEIVVAEVLQGDEFCPRGWGRTELRDVEHDRISLFELDEVDLRGRVELCEDER